MPRHISRWKLTDGAARCFTTMMMCLRGSVCLYQGEELALPEAEVSFEDLQDPYGKRFWPDFKGRDGCRTPMVWEPSNQNGGFTQASPWLPVSHEHLNHAVSTQEQDPAAILHHYRRAVAFRRSHPALVKGDIRAVGTSGNILHFIRSQGDQDIFCAFNLSHDPSTMELPAGKWRQIGAELGSGGVAPDGKIHLGPWQPALSVRVG